MNNRTTLTQRRLIYENVKNRFTHHFKRFSNHIIRNFEKKNACLIHLISFILSANRC